MTVTEGSSLVFLNLFCVVPAVLASLDPILQLKRFHALRYFDASFMQHVMPIQLVK